MAKIKVKLNYRQYKLDLLKTFAELVLTGIYNNVATFMTPTVLQATFSALVSDYGIKLIAYKSRTLSKAEFDLSKAALLNALNMLAPYVDIIALGDPVIINLAGFDATKGSNSATNAPVQPTGITFAKGITAQFETDCKIDANAESYGAVLVPDNALPANVGMNGLGQLVIIDGSGATTTSVASVPVITLKGIIDFNKSRKKTFSNLQMGTTYFLYYWAMNAGGVSPLSDPVSKKMVEW